MQRAAELTLRRVPALGTGKWAIVASAPLVTRSAPDARRVSGPHTLRGLDGDKRADTDASTLVAAVPAVVRRLAEVHRAELQWLAQHHAFHGLWGIGCDGDKSDAVREFLTSGELAAWLQTTQRPLPGNTITDAPCTLDQLSEQRRLQPPLPQAHEARGPAHLAMGRNVVDSLNVHRAEAFKDGQMGIIASPPAQREARAILRPAPLAWVAVSPPASPDHDAD